jgi:hypothetical protein
MAVYDEWMTDITTQRKGRSQTPAAVERTEDFLPFRVVGAGDNLRDHGWSLTEN